VFLQALQFVPFIGIGSDCGIRLLIYKIDLSEPQHYVHDRVNGCQCNSLSWWNTPYYFAIGAGLLKKKGLSIAVASGT
jgi:hypothetical protein